MNKLKSAMLSMAAAAALFAGGAQAAETVKMGVAAEPYPPFTVPDAQGNWSGWEIDIAQAVCAAEDLDCVITPVAWDGIIPALTSGKIDMIVASLSITDAREKIIDFSDKYYTSPTVVIEAKGAGIDAVTNEALDGMLLGVQGASIHEKYARKHFPDATIKIYATQDEANQDLYAGRLDAVQADGLALDDFLKSEDGIACCELVGNVEPDPSVISADVGFGIRQDDTALKDKLNAGIAAILENGTYEKISDEYFDFDIYGGN
ncbi:transporter substrate-binding domain-containing protein [Martelella mediterranea]|uniref:Amino acid ABC transporter substrate-binding protein (PAAT family) n=1 Tax=Martelella mediterranea TaxID=293089 RepID=A0A4R3NYM2_9HYPH|nr:amino acid ABC transporter substrate-binding protein (PAAT family) [Martelella mediterranea]